MADETDAGQPRAKVDRTDAPVSPNEEENERANMFINYQNKRGGTIVLLDVKVNLHSKPRKQVHP